MYRNLECVNPETASTIWHTDNNNDDTSKIIFYLTDVSENSAPFEYLRHKDTQKTVRIKASLTRKYPGGRIPANVIDNYLRNGYENFKVLGPKGTMLLFDNKIIHKGNVARVGYRDVLMLQMVPSVFKVKNYIDSKFTRSGY